MIDIELFKTELYNWALTLSGGEECYYVNDNGPKPDSPAISMQILSMPTINHPHKGAPDNAGLRSITREAKLWLKLDTYGANAIGRLSPFVIANYIVPASEPLRASTGLSMVNNTDILDITGLNDIDNEERATVNIMFNFGDRSDNIDSGLIENVEGIGTYKDPEGNETNRNFLINTP